VVYSCVGVSPWWLSTVSLAPSPLPALQTGRARLRHPASGSESDFRNQEVALELVQGG
jgi:hypothetical protein